MSVLDRFRGPKRSLEDPVFGRLEFDNKSCWKGSVLFRPIEAGIAVTVETGGPDPGDVHRIRFRELEERYSALVPSIAKALFDLWEPYLEEWDAESKRPPSPLPQCAEDMVRRTQLDCLTIEEGDLLVLSYGFLPEVGWDDAMMSVEVKAWRVTPKSLDD